MRIQRARGEKEDGDHRAGYRTHLIFAGKRDVEGGPGQARVSNSGNHSYFASSPTTLSSQTTHPFGHAQQSIIRQDKSRPTSRTPEVPLFRQSPGQASTGGATNAVTTGGSPAIWTPSSGGCGRGLVSSGIGLSSPQHAPYHQQNGCLGASGIVEVVSALSTDCFIIPLECINRFLPTGLTLPEDSKGNNSTTTSHKKATPSIPLNVLEVADPQLAIVVHLMTPLTSQGIPNDCSVTNLERVQLSLAMQPLQKAASERQASHGLLLESMEMGSDFPIMTLYTIQRVRVDGNNFVEKCRKSSLDSFDENVTGYCSGDHYFHLCREVATIVLPTPEVINEIATTTGDKNKGSAGRSTTGYVVSIFRVFEGDDKEKFERNWLYWTGARALYSHLPKSAGLRRITLHKSTAIHGDKLYLLLCECANLLENVNNTAQLLPALRARLCGYIGIYRVAAAF